MTFDLVLINPNTIKPAVAPLGIEYLAEACDRAGYDVDVLDLCFADDPYGAIRAYFASNGAKLVGITLRNTDNCYLLSSHSFIDDLADLVEVVSAVTDAPIVLGGAGYSVAPEQVLRRSGADFGIVGDGETPIVQLARAIDRSDSVADIPGLVYRRDDAIERNAPQWAELADQPPLRRRWLDYKRYFREGGQGSTETKRGCDGRCIYCADRHSKGSSIRLRRAETVVDEMQRLLEMGIDCLHLCDSEFNIPAEHAEAVCREIVRRGIGEQIRWYGYLAPQPFSRGLADLMRRAGCVGIDFGLDSGDAEMLGALGRRHSPQEAAQTVRLCRDAGIVVMLDLLIGGPGETKATAATSIEFARDCDPDCVGIALGMRIYPGTAAAELVAAEGLRADNPNLYGAIEGNPGFAEPIFYLSQQLGTPSEAEAYLGEVIAGDERFLFGGGEDENSDYDYDDNAMLVDAIAGGARGAYWDIIRRMKSGGL